MSFHELKQLNDKLVINTIKKKISIRTIKLLKKKIKKPKELKAYVHAFLTLNND